MHFKLIIALTEDQITNKIVDAARARGATGVTVISYARGEGLNAAKTFLGMDLDLQKNVLLLLVEEHLSRSILETIQDTGGFDTNPGAGIAFMLDVEDAVGVMRQVDKLTAIVEEDI